MYRVAIIRMPISKELSLEEAKEFRDVLLKTHFEGCKLSIIDEEGNEVETDAKEPLVTVIKEKRKEVDIKCKNCGYYYATENEEYPTCHYGYADCCAPCEEEDIDTPDDYYG